MILSIIIRLNVIIKFYIMKRDSREIIEINIDSEESEKLYKRISVFLEKYHRHQMLKTKALNFPVKSRYDLQDLCFSCYIQGLHDADKALTYKKEKDV